MSAGPRTRRLPATPGGKVAGSRGFKDQYGPLTLSMEPYWSAA